LSGRVDREGPPASSGLLRLELCRSACRAGGRTPIGSSLLRLRIVQPGSKRRRHIAPARIAWLWRTRLPPGRWGRRLWLPPARCCLGCCRLIPGTAGGYLRLSPARRGLRSCRLRPGSVSGRCYLLSQGRSRGWLSPGRRSCLCLRLSPGRGSPRRIWLLPGIIGRIIHNSDITSCCVFQPARSSSRDCARKKLLGAIIKSVIQIFSIIQSMLAIIQYRALT
jgi:hypothetical protein